MFTKLKTFAGRVWAYVKTNPEFTFVLFLTAVSMTMFVATELDNRELRRVNEALRPKCPCECDVKSN